MPAEAAAQPVPQFSHREILEILSGALLGLLLAALDQTVVVTALPAIAGDLNGRSISPGSSPPISSPPPPRRRSTASSATFTAAA